MERAIDTGLFAGQFRPYKPVANSKPAPPTKYRRPLVNMRLAQLTRVADESQSGVALSQSGDHCTGCLKVSGVKRVVNELQV